MEKNICCLKLILRYLNVSMQNFKAMKTLKSLSNRDENFPYLLLLESLIVFYFLVYFVQQIALICKLHHSTFIK